MRCRAHNREHCDLDCRIDTIDAALNEILTTLNRIERTQTIMANEVDDLTAAVEEQTTVDASIQTLVTQLAAAYAATQGDLTKVNALTAKLRANNAGLTAAIQANTPADPATANPPTP